MIIACLALVAALLLAASLLWSLVVNALPLWCGAFVALQCHGHGGGFLLSGLAGLAAAIALLALRGIAMTDPRAPLLRAGLGLGFAGAAALAGYHAAHGIAAATIGPCAVQVVISWGTALIAATAAWRRCALSGGPVNSAAHWPAGATPQP